ncbi:MAG: TIR domain-containing protein [Sphingobium sp.]|nr:TIR domain-containing protein [Sphingobium sp.]
MNRSTKVIEERGVIMPIKTKLFVSFDFDHDSRLKDLFVGQAKHPDTPFELADWSIKEEISENWKKHARTRLRSVNCMAVLCGKNTHTARGIDAEIEIAREEKVPYFLLKGYSSETCTKPRAAANETMYNWTWDNVSALLKGAR